MVKTFKQFVAEQQHPMIDVDGVQKHRNNSEGKPIHPTDEGIKNFHRWFGDSKAVDHHGRPQVVYHGTQTDFSHFSSDHAKSVSSDDIGHFFTSDHEEASNHAQADWWRDDPHPNVMPAYLKMKNPVHVDNVSQPARWYDNNGRKASIDALNKGHDGMKIGNLHVVYKPDQIKSTIGNNGQFSDKWPHNIHEDKQ